jgi:hypothetical protein
LAIHSPPPNERIKKAFDFTMAKSGEILAGDQSHQFRQKFNVLQIISASVIRE